MKRVNRLMLIVLILSGIGSCRPIGHPPIEELLIDQSAFPEGWIVSVDDPSPIARAPLGGTKSVESTELFFYVTGGSASERIRRFTDSQGAAEEFARQKMLIFRVTEFNTTWVIPKALTFESTSANQFYYACSKSVGSPWPDCAYIAQYGVYFTQFETGMITGHMSYSDFENVLKILDERMAPFGKDESK